MRIYQARFMRYLENRGIIPATPRKIWAFVGDGETRRAGIAWARSRWARARSSTT